MKIKPAIVFRIIGAAVAAGSEIADAAREDSPGGKRITPDEAEEVWAAFVRALKPRFLAALVE